MRSKKILFITIPEKGHLNPLIGIAQHLQKEGVGIAFFAQADISEQLTKADINCKCFTPASQVHVPKDFITHGADFAQKIKDRKWLRQWIKTLLIDLVPAQIDSLSGVVEKYAPDIIVSDPMVYAAAIVAERKGIPWVGVSNSLNPITPDHWSCELVDTLKEYRQERKALFKDLSWEAVFRVSDLISPWLNIVFSTEEYIPRSLSKNNFSFYVGAPFPLEGKRGDETDFPFDKLDAHKSKVYMSLGSQIYYHPHLFRAVAEALRDENVQLIFSVSGLYHEGFAEEFPADSIILPYVPQLEVLKHVDVMISHGGANSVLESLANGVPLALVPLCNDQFLQARFVEHANVGIVLDAEQPVAEDYKRDLQRLLKPGNIYSVNAKKVKESFSKYGGARQATDLIIKLMLGKTPLIP